MEWACQALRRPIIHSGPEVRRPTRRRILRPTQAMVAVGEALQVEEDQRGRAGLADQPHRAHVVVGLIGADDADPGAALCL